MAAVPTEGGRVVLRLDPVAEAVGEARRYVRSALADFGRSDLEDSAVLGVSELVTNPAIHARTPFTVMVARTDVGAIRITVRDFSPALPRQRRYGLESITGRGLRQVESISTAWGVEQANDESGPGKVVWFEPGTDQEESAFADTDWLSQLGSP